MESYKNLSGLSGVRAYEIGPHHIRIQFKGPKIYTYSTRLNSSGTIEHMKELAVSGQGLGTFINKNSDVRESFDE